MPIFRWRDRQDVIARLINEKDIHGFLKQDVVLNPGEAAVILARGKIDEVATQTDLKKIGGGFMNWVRRKLDMESAVQLLFLVTTPVQCELPVTMTTKDYQTMKGSVTIRFQLNTENATKIINLMARGTVLTTSELENKIQTELIAMVFSNIIAKHTVDEFHGNVNIQKEMETTAAVELRKTFDLWGLELTKLFSVWHEGAYDELMKYKAELTIYDGKMDAYNDSMLKSVQREHDYNLKIIESRWELRLGDLKGEERVKTEKFLAELERDKAKFDENLRREREKIALRKEEREAILETDRERVDLDLHRDRSEMEIAMDSFDRVQAAKRQRMKMDHDFKTSQMAMQTSSTERIMSKALDSDAADSAALQEMMRQQTMQKMADRDSDKVKALSEAEAKRHELGSYKSAEDRERDYETSRMDLSAKQMAAAKQNVPQTLVQGATSTPTITHAGADKSATNIPCPNCGAPVQAGWKACPACGEKI